MLTVDFRVRCIRPTNQVVSQGHFRFLISNIAVCNDKKLIGLFISWIYCHLHLTKIRVLNVTKYSFYECIWFLGIDWTSCVYTQWKTKLFQKSGDKENRFLNPFLDDSSWFTWLRNSSWAILSSEFNDAERIRRWRRWSTIDFLYLFYRFLNSSVIDSDIPSDAI